VLVPRTQDDACAGGTGEAEDAGTSGEAPSMIVRVGRRSHPRHSFT
jgi:hypothetical protein